MLMPYPWTSESDIQKGLCRYDYIMDLWIEKVTLIIWASTHKSLKITCPPDRNVVDVEVKCLRIRRTWCAITSLRTESAMRHTVQTALTGWGRLPADTSKEVDLSPPTTKGWILPTTWRSLEALFFPESSNKKSPDDWHLDLGLVKPRTEKPAKLIWASDLQSSEIINLCCLKLFTLWSFVMK